MHNLTTSRHIRSATELFIMVPIRNEFVPITDVVMTYARRISAVLKLLGELRQQKVERGFGDPIGPIEQLHTIYRVQWTVLEPFDDVSTSGVTTRQLRTSQVILTSHFDSSWEDYFTALVTVGGPLLDLIFSHCEGYEGHSCKHGYEKFADFIRRHQRPCNFLYATSPEVTIDDIRYFNRLPARVSEGPAGIRHFRVPTVREEAKSLGVGPTAFDERTRSAARAIYALYDTGKRLFTGAPALTTPQGVLSDTKLYDDAIVSVLKLEPDLKKLAAVVHAPVDLAKNPPGSHALPKEIHAATDWIETRLREHFEEEAARATKQAQAVKPALEDEVSTLLREVQGNILSGYRDVAQGRLLMFQCSSAQALIDLLRAAQPLVTTEADSRKWPAARGKIDRRVNLGITYSGFELLDLPAVLEALPREFREGMEERAGVLGDIGPNHPSFWKLPRRQNSRERVQLTAIHVVMILIGDDRAHAALMNDLGGIAGSELVHVLMLDPTDQPELSQPVPPKDYRESKLDTRDEVPLSKLLLGHPSPGDAGGPPAELAPLFENSTFLAMRKMYKNQAAFDGYVDQVASLISEASESAKTADRQVLRDEATALIVGRMPARTDKQNPASGKMLGELEPSNGGNEFDFSKDPHGDLCPFHSHVRRANPRPDPTKPEQDTAPRIVRRGLPYAAEKEGAELEAGEKGLLFMAYCASLAEQYEIVQRWVNGGNSTGILSRHNDILCGPLVDNGIPRVVSLRGTSAGKTGDGPATLTLPRRTGGKPFVELRWGLYLFVPSMTAISWLVKPIGARAGRADAAVVRGAAWIEEIATLKDPARRAYEWKRLLEEVPEADSAQARSAEDVAAAITVNEKGVYVTEPLPMTEGEAPVPLVIVTTEALAARVLQDDTVFSVSEYRSRLERALQDHYLGYDLESTDPKTGRDYARLSTEPNALFKGLKTNAFVDAYGKTNALLDDPFVIELDPDGVSPDETKRHTISVRDLGTAVIAQLCHEWLDMPGKDKQYDLRALMDSLDRFLIASRYCFQAMPVAHLQGVARKNHDAIEKDYAELSFQGDVALSLNDDTLTPEQLQDYRRMAVLGAVGFAPPAVGAVTRILDQWIETEELWQIQQRVRSAATQQARLKALQEAIYSAWSKTPAPPTLYRTVVKDDMLGGTKVTKGARVVVNLAAVYKNAPKTRRDAWLFGGDHGGATAAGFQTRHGCPGRDAGILVLAGIFTALFERKSLRREGRLLLSYEK